METEIHNKSSATMIMENECFRHELLCTIFKKER